MKLKLQLFVLFLLPFGIAAQSYRWTGSSADNDFFNEANWIDSATEQPPEDGSIDPSESINADLFLTCDVGGGATTTGDATIASLAPTIFSAGANTAWPYVFTAATQGDGTNGAYLTFVIHVTSLPAEGANYRIVRTVTNENWDYANPKPLTLGTNTIHLNGVSFDRTVKFQFSSGAVVFDELTLNGNPIYSLPGGSIVLNPSNTLELSNGTLDAFSFSGGRLVLKQNAYVNLTGADPLLNGTQVFLNADLSWLRLDAINANQANDDYLSQITVFDQAAEYPINIRLDNYYDHGTVIRPQNLEVTPLSIFTNENLTGTEAEIQINQIYQGVSIPNQMNDNIRSFVLKKGYMATMAVNTDGTGKSKVFIASEEDLEVHALPTLFEEGVSFIRILPWNWVSKKGTGGDILGMNNTWYYRWNNKWDSDLQRECPPMAWGYNGANDADDILIYQSKYKTTHVLGFNEPDDCNGQSGQYNNLCDINTALGVYENLMKTGMRLVSPACRQGAVFDWLDPFYQQAIQNDIRIDVIAVHWYDWGGSPQDSPNGDATSIFNRFKNYLTDVFALYGLPIWITEFNGNKYRTPAVNEQFMRLAIPYLESLDYVERYAWFEPLPIVEGEVLGNAEFYDANTDLTQIGHYYKNHASTPSIPEPSYSGPDNLSSGVVNSYTYSCDPSNLLSSSQSDSPQTYFLKVIPNPATTNIKVIHSEPIESLNIYTIHGALIHKKMTTNTVDISDLKKGIYFIKVNQYHAKFVKL